MKKTQRTDALRNVRKEKISWISILIIAALAVTTFLGINFGAQALAKNGDRFFRGMNYRDVEILSTMLVTEDDLSALRALDGVEDAEGVYFTSGKAESRSAAGAVDVISLTGRINVPRVVEGRLPLTARECAVEQDVATALGLSPGDPISVRGENGGDADRLKTGEFTVVGIVDHPDHAVLEMTVPGNRYVVATPEAFDTDALDGAYMRAEVKIRGSEGGNLFTDQYFDAISGAAAEIRALAGTREAMRTAQVRAEYEDKVETARREIGDAESDLADARAELDRGWEEYRAGEQALAAAGIETAEYAFGRATLDETRQALERGETEYAEGLEKLADGKARLAEAEGSLAGLDECRWVVLDAEGNAGYQAIRGAADNMRSLGTSFALLFVLVGAIVIYATLGKIIEDQRKLVGTSKALGLRNGEIFAKYLAFGLSATLAGIVVGTLLGCFGIQYFLLLGFTQLYVYDDITLSFSPLLTILAFVLGAALTALAVWAATAGLVRSTATRLMQEDVPEARGKSKGKESRLPLYTRLIFRNMRADVKRIAVMIVSIAGCCTLLITGFTMRDSIYKAVERQFARVERYDAAVTYDSSVSETAAADVAGAIEAGGGTWAGLTRQTLAYSDGGKLSYAVVDCGDLREISAYFNLLDADTSAPIPYDGRGVFITARISDLLDLHAGDGFTLYDDAMDPHEAVVAGVFENYLGNGLFLSPESWREIFGESPEENGYLVRTPDVSGLEETLGGIAGFGEFHDTDVLHQDYINLTSALDLVAVSLTVVAGLMTYFILLNLINMYISQKKRELTIMRVNGFTVGEVKRYVMREAFVTTTAGIVVGGAAGIPFARYVIELIEQPSMRFVHDVQWAAVAISAAITVAFTVGIYLFALRKIKDLKLTDVQ